MVPEMRKVRVWQMRRALRKFLAMLKVEESLKFEG